MKREPTSEEHEKLRSDLVVIQDKLIQCSEKIIDIYLKTSKQAKMAALACRAIDNLQRVFNVPPAERIHCDGQSQTDVPIVRFTKRKPSGIA